MGFFESLSNGLSGAYSLGKNLLHKAKKPGSKASKFMSNKHVQGIVGMLDKAMPEYGINSKFDTVKGAVDTGNKYMTKARKFTNNIDGMYNAYQGGDSLINNSHTKQLVGSINKAIPELGVKKFYKVADKLNKVYESVGAPMRRELTIEKRRPEPKDKQDTPQDMYDNGM